MERTLPDELTTSRIHGDLHLGQTLRCDQGWLVLDFEGEPIRPLDAARGAVVAAGGTSAPCSGRSTTPRSSPPAAGTTPTRIPTAASGARWARPGESAIAPAFCNGYVAHLPKSIPVAEAEVEPLVRFFEVAKAAYEVGYELAHRPELVDIPQAAIRGLLAEP